MTLKHRMLRMVLFVKSPPRQELFIPVVRVAKNGIWRKVDENPKPFRDRNIVGLSHPYSFYLVLDHLHLDRKASRLNKLCMSLSAFFESF